MVLDPEHDWIMREYMVHTGQSENNCFHHTFQIREGTDRHPIITRHTQQFFNKDEIQSIEEAELQTVERLDAPIEEFKLSAFGLPEPPGRQVAKSRLHLRLALVGLVCLGIAALIRWRYRRAKGTV